MRLEFPQLNKRKLKMLTIKMKCFVTFRILDFNLPLFLVLQYSQLKFVEHEREKYYFNEVRKKEVYFAITQQTEKVTNHNPNNECCGTTRRGLRPLLFQLPVSS